MQSEHNTTIVQPDKKNPAKKSEGVREEPELYELDWKPQNDYEQEAVKIVELLNDHGAKAYFTGGYPRDLIMSQDKGNYPDFVFDPHDIDVSTNIPHEEIERILKEAGYKNVKEGGANFTVVHLHHRLGDRTMKFEIAPFRTEGSYGPDRKPKEVKFTPDIREDVARRDFTIGGMYFDPQEKKIIDYVGGVNDIKNKVLRMIGSAEERIDEDPLRMLRYVRFRNKYGLNFDRDIQAVLRKNAQKLHNLPAARFKGEEQGELDKILRLPRAARAVIDLARLGLLEEILPEVKDLKDVRHTPQGAKSTIHREGGAFRHTLETLRAVNRKEFLQQVREKLRLDSGLSQEEVMKKFYQRYGIEWAWAVLLCDIGKGKAQQLVEKEGRGPRFRFIKHEEYSQKMAQAAAERFKFSNQGKRKMLFWIENHMMVHNLTGDKGPSLSARKRDKLFHDLADPKDAEALLFLSLADELGNIKDDLSSEQKVELFNKKWGLLEEFKERQKQIAGGGEIRKHITEILFAGAVPPKGAPVFSPLEEFVYELLVEGRISTKEISEVVVEIKEIFSQKEFDFTYKSGVKRNNKYVLDLLRNKFRKKAA